MVKIEKTGTDTDLTEFLCELAGYPPGTYQVTIYPVGDLRSSEQNRYLWGVVYPLLLEGLKDIGYAYTTTQEVHEFCKRTFSDRYVNYHSGEIIDIPESKAYWIISDTFSSTSVPLPQVLAWVTMTTHPLSATHPSINLLVRS